MQERKEKIQPTQIAFFDADKTLWQVKSLTPGDDYASRGYLEGNSRTFLLSAETEVVRLEDGSKFVLKEGVVETFEKLSKEGITIGLISDNIYDDVEEVCKRLGIWEYFDEKFVNIFLSVGTAEKGSMIKKVLDDQEISGRGNILLVDDGQAYLEKMTIAGFNFILSPKDTFPKDSILEFFGVK